MVSTPNPFIDGDAEDIRRTLAQQLDLMSTSPFGVFQFRAAALFAALAPPLVWLRDHRDLSLSTEVIRFSTKLVWIWKLAMEKVVLCRDGLAGTAVEQPVPEIPDQFIQPLRLYLAELPGCNLGRPFDEMSQAEPGRQHAFLAYHAATALTRLSAHP